MLLPNIIMQCSTMARRKIRSGLALLMRSHDLEQGEIPARPVRSADLGRVDTHSADSKWKLVAEGSGPKKSTARLA